jgi:hypothetical protein
MPLTLNGMQKKDLRRALLAAFPSASELRRMTSDQLDENLAAITAQSESLEQNAFDLISWAEAHGRLAELVSAGRNQNSGNPDLQDFAARIGLSSAASVKTSTLEKVVSSNATFLDVAKWRAELTRAEWRVCRVDRDGQGFGTGFLVGADLVLTNHHVVDDLLGGSSLPSSWSCRFDHKLSETGGVISMGRVVKLASDWKVDAAPPSDVDGLADPKPHDPAEGELDYALLRLAEPVGAEPVGKGSSAEEARGWVQVPSGPVDYPAKRVIASLQHPKTLPMKLALGMDETLEVTGGGRRLHYKVPTEPGSSGSPVFDGDFGLIALHHSGDPKEPKPAYNEGIPIALIAARPLVAAALKA